MEGVVCVKGGGEVEMRGRSVRVGEEAEMWGKGELLVRDIF